MKGEGCKQTWFLLLIIGCVSIFDIVLATTSGLDFPLLCVNIPRSWGWTNGIVKISGYTCIFLSGVLDKEKNKLVLASNILALIGLFSYLWYTIFTVVGEMGVFPDSNISDIYNHVFNVAVPSSQYKIWAEMFAGNYYLSALIRILMGIVSMLRVRDIMKLKIHESQNGKQRLHMYAAFTMEMIIPFIAVFIFEMDNISLDIQCMIVAIILQIWFCHIMLSCKKGIEHYYSKGSEK